jgi:hypothetical protein
VICVFVCCIVVVILPQGENTLQFDTNLNLNISIVSDLKIVNILSGDHSEFRCAKFNFRSLFSLEL